MSVMFAHCVTLHPPTPTRGPRPKCYQDFISLKRQQQNIPWRELMVSLWLSGYLPLTALLNAALKEACAFAFDHPVTSIQFQTRRAPPWGILVAKPL